LPKLAFEELQDAQLRLCSAELRNTQEAIDAEAVSRKIDLSQAHRPQLLRAMQLGRILASSKS